MTSSADLSAPATVNVRSWRADADYAAMAQVSNACAASGMLDAFAGPADYRWMARYLQGFRPETQILLAEAGGAPAGFAHARLAGFDAVTGHVIALQVRAVPGHVGLDAELLERAEVLAQELVAGVADETGAPRTWETVVEDSESRLRTLVEQRGYRPVKQGYRMRRELAAAVPEHALPRGFELRAATLDNGLQVLRAFDEAMRDSRDYGGMPDGALERLLEQQQWMLGD